MDQHILRRRSTTACLRVTKSSSIHPFSPDLTATGCANRKSLGPDIGRPTLTAVTTLIHGECLLAYGGVMTGNYNDPINDLRVLVLNQGPAGQITGRMSAADRAMHKVSSSCSHQRSILCLQLVLCDACQNRHPTLVPWPEGPSFYRSESISDGVFGRQVPTRGRGRRRRSPPPSSARARTAAR